MSWMEPEEYKRCTKCDRKMTRRVLFTSVYYDCDACIEDEKICKAMNELNSKPKEYKTGSGIYRRDGDKLDVRVQLPPGMSINPNALPPNAYAPQQQLDQYGQPIIQPMRMPSASPALGAPYGQPNSVPPAGWSSPNPNHTYRTPINPVHSHTRGNIHPRPKFPYPIADVRQCMNGCFMRGSHCHCFSIIKNLSKVIAVVQANHKWVERFQAGDVVSTPHTDWHILVDGVYEIYADQLVRIP